MTKPKESINPKITSINLDEPARDALVKLKLAFKINSNSAIITDVLLKASMATGTYDITEESYNEQMRKLNNDLEGLQIKLDDKRVEISNFQKLYERLKSQKPMFEAKEKELEKAYEESIKLLLGKLERGDSAAETERMAINRCSIYLGNKWNAIELMNEVYKRFNKK
jgi:hypothetical protein